MANMNMVIHDMEGEIEIGDTLKNPKFKERNGLKTFDRIVANPMWNQTKKSLPYLSDDFFLNDEFNRFKLHPPTNTIDWGWVQHIFASLKADGRAAVVLDPGAVTRGSGNINKDKEKDIRRWFIENDCIECVIYLPENLFYNTPSPGLILVANRAKAKERKGQILLINASQEFTKGEPKNFVSDEGIEHIARTYQQWTEEEQFAKIITVEDAINKDFNISPSRFIQTDFSISFRPFPEIAEELKVLESEIIPLDQSLNSIISRLLEQ
jgi:type I restriction enzyme M protein